MMVVKSSISRTWRLAGKVLGGVLGLAVLLLGCQPASAQEPSIYASPIERFGFGVTYGHDVTRYDTSLLHAGWFMNWGTSAKLNRPGGLEYVQTVNVGPYIIPSLAEIRYIARTRPGSLWLVGNEPECIYQNNVYPDRYARQYHEVYSALKEADPTCKVAIGGVVQATPLRLQYLDMVWNAYKAGYGRTMPVDVWNTHIFILQEKRGSYGAEIPVGVNATEGMLYSLNDHDNMTYFRQQVVAFRQWMADKGERDKPLIVSEYGILLPEGYGFDYARVRTFMLASFDYFMTATDAQLGYPADGNRLVQRWNWYSLDDPYFGQNVYTLWSALYNPFPPYAIKQLGLDFGAYTASFPPVPTPTPMATSTRTSTPTRTPTRTMTATRTATSTLTATSTRTATKATPSTTSTRTPTPTATRTATASSTATRGTPGATDARTATPTPTATTTSDGADTPTPTATATPDGADTPTATATGTAPAVWGRYYLPLILK